MPAIEFLAVNLGKGDVDPDYATEIAAWNASLFSANNTDDIDTPAACTRHARFACDSVVRHPRRHDVLAQWPTEYLAQCTRWLTCLAAVTAVGDYTRS